MTATGRRQARPWAGVLGIACLVAAVIGLLNVGVDMNWSIIPPSVRKAVRDVRGAIFGKR